MTCASCALLRTRAVFFSRTVCPSVRMCGSALRYVPQSTQVRQSVRASLTNLRTEYVDCLVLHSPLRSYADTLRVWRQMEEAVAEGHARSLGVSNCYELSELQRLWSDARVKPSVLQNRFYAQTNFDVELRRFCASHDVQYQSFWTLTANPSAVQSRALGRVAKAHGCTREQASLRPCWPLHSSNALCVSYKARGSCAPAQR